MSREVIDMGRPYKCPFCGESRNSAKGYRKTKSLGKRQIRLCRGCNRKFTPKFQSGAAWTVGVSVKETSPSA